MKFPNARRLWVVGFFTILIAISVFTISPKQIASHLSNEAMEKGIGNFPEPAAYREDITIYSKQLINDSPFNLSSGASPWNSSLSGDLSDLNAKIENNQCNSTIVGDTRTISIVANFSQPGEWTAMQNPAFPAFPVWTGIPSYGNDSNGLWSNHSWVSAGGGLLQAPSINWGRNFSLPVNMSDYEITSVNISAVVNASVVALGTAAGLEINNTESQTPDDFVVGDYARFYVRVADLQRNKMYEIAYNRTSPDLGQDAPQVTMQVDTKMTSVNEDLLKVYLTSSLSTDFRNFTIILGTDYWCELNKPSDSDTWNMMRIKTFSLNFTFTKKISYNSYITWNETGYRINTTDYLGSGDTVDVNILNATFNFNYRLTQAWPTTSPNSEIRLYINNYLHSETIKLSDGTTSVQSIKGGEGFDVSSLVSLNQNVTIRIQIIMLDDFLIPQNCSVLIDDVNLTVYFEAAVRTNIPDTQLKLVGSTNIIVPWNNSFAITANYTVEATGIGIPGANITLDWVDTCNTTDLGNGLYEITCNTTLTSANQKYTLQIWADAFGNESQSYSADIQITGRPTNLFVFLNQQDLTGDPEITMMWNQTVNITSFYQDDGSKENLTSALVEITGTDLISIAYDYSPQGTGYQFLVDSSHYEVGTHFISLSASLGNYSFASKIITVRVTPRPTFFSILRSGINVTQDIELSVPLTASIALDLNYSDGALTLDNYDISLQGLDSTITLGTTSNIVIPTTGLEVGVYIISIIASKANYTELSHSYRINVGQIPSNLIADQESITINPQAQFTIKVTFAIDEDRMGSSGIISGANVSYYWNRGEGYLTDNGDGTFGIQLESPLTPGAYKITITALKANYELQTITINLIVQSPITEDLMPLIIGLTAGLVGFVFAFLSYLLYFRYPAVVRKIRKVRGSLKKGGKTKISSHPKKRIFVERLLKEYGENIPSEGRTKLKSQYLQLDKEEPLDRKVPEEFAPKTIIVQEIEPTKTPPSEKLAPNAARKSTPKPAAKSFEKPQQVDFGKRPEVKTLPPQKPATESNKLVDTTEAENNKVSQEEKKSSKESEKTNKNKKED